MSKDKRPIIGIPGWKTGENSFGCGINHLDFISRFGEPRILFPHDTDVELDMLYLPGGPDLTPWSYGKAPGFYTGNPDLFRQHFFDKMLPKYLEKKIPTVGVCLGMQMLNVAFGGSLEQDLKYHSQSNGRWQKGHDAYIVGVSRKQGKFEVNSHHHQAVLVKTLAPELEVLVYADNEESNNEEDVIVECFKHKTLPVVGFQWHPEEWRDGFSMSLIRDLLNQ